ncbi:Protein GrpE [Fundidesulfovibrio magnetotacticus]|uniref:Protein GrpE n=1 Tax=Fundidesulfovibrio magnetotacticus TaxID=2730080 RepID=A0A6V8LK73_9BACT|nr:nucleotide exchange factor GrpE [Fundidesulfovibrio magnetotacticus]GFK93122.1 Protein GrpE [Fundidesulfovibrio magnetotacticus]
MTTPENDAPAEAPLSLEEQVEKLKQEVAAEADKRLRALAETENLKKRLIREKEEFVRYAAESVLADLLPVLDNLDLALAHGAAVPGCKDVVLGVEMTRKVFLDTLARHGLEPCGAPGEEFNPEIHEAVGAQPGGGMAPGHVLSVMQAGYRLRGRLLRPAKVMVSQ